MATPSEILALARNRRQTEDASINSTATAWSSAFADVPTSILGMLTDALNPTERLKSTAPFSDTTLYRAEGIISANAIAHVRDYTHQETLITRCISVIADETIGAGIAVRTVHGTDPPGIWRWNAPDTLNDIKDMLVKANRHFHMYGFVVLAIPRDPLRHMREYARGPGRDLLEASGVYPPQRLRIRRATQPATGPLTAGDRLGNEWICGAMLIDPADLGCDFTIYKSFTHEPTYYIAPHVPNVASSSSSNGSESIRETPLTNLLREFRLVTYPSGREDWRPMMGRLSSPVARLMPDAVELAARRLYDADAIATQARGTLIVELHPTPKNDVALTPLDINTYQTLKKDTTQDAKEGRLPATRVALEVDDGTHIVPLSTSIWNLNTDLDIKVRTLKELNKLHAGNLVGDTPALETYARRRLQCFNTPETATEDTSKMLIKLPPQAKMVYFKSPEPHVKETADFDNNLRNKTLQTFGLRENAFAATSITNSLASTGMRAVSAAQTTAIASADKSRSENTAVLNSALSHPSTLRDSRLELTRFFEFLEEEALRPLLSTGEKYIRNVRASLARLESSRRDWESKLRQAIEVAKMDGDTEIVVELESVHQTAVRDREEATRGIRRNEAFIQGLGIALDYVGNFVDRFTIVFDQRGAGVDEEEEEGREGNAATGDSRDKKKRKNKKKRKDSVADSGDAKRPKRMD